MPLNPNWGILELNNDLLKEALLHAGSRLLTPSLN